MEKERARRVSKVTSTFSNGVPVGIMRVGLPWASSCLHRYEPQDEPLEEKTDLETEVAVRCPKCHSEDVIFEHLSGDSHSSEREADEDSEAVAAPDEEENSAAGSRKFDWTCASCGYKWEDEGIETN
jgi:hypothetical protein